MKDDVIRVVIRRLFEVKVVDRGDDRGDIFLFRWIVIGSGAFQTSFLEMGAAQCFEF